jgi:UDP-N-acetylmuramoyl-tripeptide--D-alanyl-D-alanine ligase
LFYNGDEPLLQARIKNLAERMQLIPFGQSTTNQYYPSNVQLESDGATFCLNERTTPIFYSPLLGFHNVLNSLIGLAIGETLGVHLAAMQEPLARLKITGMRGERLATTQGTVILNDAYNASPASMRAALEMLASMNGFSRKIVVLADMLELGEQSIDYHKQIGDLLDPSVIEQVFTFGPQAAYIAEQAALRFGEGKVVADLNKHEIAKAIATAADQHTVVLVKGSRGMKLEEVVQQLCAEI